MSWEAISREYDSEVVGPEIVRAVRTLSGQVARHYPPGVYASSPSWDAAALEELVQDVVEQLLRDGQIDYVMLTAHGLSEFERLVTQQIKRCLSKRRRRTIVDNLLDRSRAILTAPPFEEVPGQVPARYRLAGTEQADREPTPSELRAAALVARAVPQDSSGVVRERAPRVYTNVALSVVLEGVVRTLATPVTLRHLDHIFRLLLTDLIPSDLEELGDVEAVDEADASASADPESAAVVRSVVKRLIGRLTDEQKVILRMKAADVADGEVATVIGVSRPTLASRKHDVFEVVRVETADLDSDQRELAVTLVLHELARTGDR